MPIKVVQTRINGENKPVKSPSKSQNVDGPLAVTSNEIRLIEHPHNSQAYFVFVFVLELFVFSEEISIGANKKDTCDVHHRTRHDVVTKAFAFS